VIFFLITTIDHREKLIKPKVKEESILYKPVAMIFPMIMKLFGGEIKFLEGK